MELRQGKNWGYTTEFFRNAIVSAHHLEVNKGGFCSEHRHQHKFNLFYVISGKLEVTIWRSPQTKDVTIIEAGQATAVSPGDYHMFRGLEKTEAIEVYQVLLIGEDIDRRTKGGIDKK